MVTELKNIFKTLLLCISSPLSPTYLLNPHNFAGRMLKGILSMNWMLWNPLFKWHILSERCYCCLFVCICLQDPVFQVKYSVSQLLLLFVGMHWLFKSLSVSVDMYVLVLTEYFTWKRGSWKTNTYTMIRVTMMKLQEFNI